MGSDKQIGGFQFASKVQNTKEIRSKYPSSNDLLDHLFRKQDLYVHWGVAYGIKDGKFEPKQLAYFEKDPNIKIDPVDSTAKVQITNYGIHNINLDAEATGNNLLFLSEVYYPAGWKAYIDGQQTEILKTNYLFRGIVVPKGKHKIEFKFEPETYYLGKNITIGTNILLILVFIVAIGGIFIKKSKKSAKITENPGLNKPENNS